MKNNTDQTQRPAPEQDDAHNLMPDWLRAELRPLYASEDERNPRVIVKYFTPDANWTWYAWEFDGEDTFFGYVVGLDRELGYFSLADLQRTRGRLGLAIERDLYFDPATTLRDVRRSK